MKQTFLLKGTPESSYLEISLKSVLGCIDNGQNLHWKILWLNAISNTDEINILELEQSINLLNDGYSIKWQDLITLSNSIHQVFDLTVIGDQDESHLRRYNSDDEMKDRCRFCLELIDSSYWEITSHDIDFLFKIKKQYRIIDLSDPQANQQI